MLNHSSIETLLNMVRWEDGKSNYFVLWGKLTENVDIPLSESKDPAVDQNDKILAFLT